MENEPYIADITIDRSSPDPLHTQIAEPLAQLIESGELPPGTRIEDEISMAARLHVSRPTARRAFETLTQRGLVIRRRGIGTQVTPTRVHRAMNLTSLYDDLQASGQRPRTSVLDWKVETAPPAVAAALGLPSNSEVTHFRRLRMSQDEPLAIMTNWVPVDLAPSAEALTTTGFYNYLRSRDVAIAVGHQLFSARLALPDEARLLNEPAGAALLTMQRTACDESNRVIEFGQHVYRASIYAYENTVYA